MTPNSDTDHRIVVGTDGSPSSIAALEWAANQAQLTGAALEVLMTWEWPTSYGWSIVPDNYDPTRDCEKVLAEVLAPIQEAHPDLPIRPAVIEGHPAPLLVKASHGADLLVVGSRGHGNLSACSLGR